MKLQRINSLRREMESLFDLSVRLRKLGKTNQARRALAKASRIAHTITGVNDYKEKA